MINVNTIVESFAKGMRQGIAMWPEAWLITALDQVSEHPEVTEEEADAMLRTAILALIVRAARAEAARRVG